MNGVTIEAVDAEMVAARLDEYAVLLRDCVHDGANINFVLPFEMDDAAAFWRQKALPRARSGGKVIWSAELDGRLVGSVQLDLDLPPNQPHRAEVAKLMVHPDARRRGIAKALMAALEDEARRRGRWLVTLDTRTGDKAEPLYASLGYETAGVIPDFCIDPVDRRLFGTTVMFKRLEVVRPE